MGTTQQDEEWWREEEEDALSTALKGRPPRTNPYFRLFDLQSKEEEAAATAADSTTNTTATTNEGEGDHNEPLAAAAEHQSGGGGGSTLESERSIYFDTTDGTQFTKGNAPTKLGNGVHTPQTLITDTNHLKDENHSVLPLLLSQTLPSKGTTAPHTPVELPQLEVTEWNVEKVLDQQETHDLFCPNCHSCITKRVILRKRKRKPNLQDDSKRGKTEIVQSSPLATSDDQSYNAALPSIDATPPSVDNRDEDHVTGPDLFRCLSCFSFFIPSVASFKSFRFFRDRGEHESVENREQTPSRTGGVQQGGEGAIQRVKEVASEDLQPQSDQVSSAILVSNDSCIQPPDVAKLERRENENGAVGSSTTSVVADIVKNGLEEKPFNADIKNKEGEEGALQHVKEVASEDLQPQYQLTHQSDQVSSVIPVSNGSLIQTLNVAVLERREDRNGTVGSSTTSVMVEIVKNGVEEKPYGAVIKNKEGYDAMQDQRPGELTKPSPSLDGDYLQKNNDSILNSSGAHTPWFSSTNYEGNSKVVPTEEGNDFQIMSEQEALLPRDEHASIQKELEGLPVSTDAGKDVILLVESEQVWHGFPQSVQTNIGSSQPGILINRDTEYGGEGQVNVVGISSNWDVLKSIVYGGLVESITSLGVVSSAAGGDATTLNIIALGLACLVGGLFMIIHELIELKHDQYGEATDPDEITDRYQELLGKRTRFRLHATVAILSYLVFGLVAPVTYSFSFLESHNKEYKLIAVAVASLVCIALLASAKAHVQKPPKAYIKTTLYYVSMGVMSSGLSFVVGMLIQKLLERLGWFAQEEHPVPSAFLETVAVKSSRASY